MASSKKPHPSRSSLSSTENHLIKHLEGILRPLVQPQQKLLLAFSGGLDSRVLLDLLVKLKPVLEFELHAMHVHHGLSPNADKWSYFCIETCHDLGVPITVERVEVPRNNHLGIEATARKARYTVLNAAEADFILLAHHQDDQAETLLLQMLRGAGIKGLSAMAEHDVERRYVRPLLNVSRAALFSFARQHNLQWVEDESNTDVAYDRNYLRHQILPVMEARFPAARKTLARTTSHLAEAYHLLDELAELDAKQCIQGEQLDLSTLASLSEPRARNLLRWWLSFHELAMPSSKRLQEMLRQLLHARRDAALKIAVGDDLWLRRYRDFAYLEATGTIRSGGLTWQGESELQLPDGTKLLFEEKVGTGLAAKRLGITRLQIRYRQGGERFKPAANRPTRTLKHLLQEAGMPPWERERLPLIHHGESLAVVPGFGVAADLQADATEFGLEITWQQCSI